MSRPAIPPRDMEDLIRRVMQQWPLYTPAAHVLYHETTDGTLIVQYCGEFPGRPFTADMHLAHEPPNSFALNILPHGPCYLLSIYVVAAQRGQGHGSRLYELIIELARELGCRSVWQLPSGTTHDKDSRMNYLLRRGWEETASGQVWWNIYKDR